MSLSNIRDSMVKNTLVTEFQQRATEMQRTQDAAAQHAQAEKAREAEEVIVQLSHAADDNPIREDKQGGRNPKDQNDEDEERPPHEPPEEPDDIPPNVGSHRLDIVV